MSKTQTDGAGRPLGNWSWRVSAQRLAFDVPEGSVFSGLNGEWSLEGIGAILEGLSRRDLAQVFKAGEGPVRCALTLSSGEQVQLVGAFTEKDEARGIILDGFYDLPAQDLAAGEVPGPDLEPVFQPIVSLGTGDVAGFEALARWSDGDRSQLRLDDMGLATNMLIRAAETLASLRSETGRADLFMHVNVTARDLTSGEVPHLVEALMAGHDLPPKALRIELTEQAALRDSGDALQAARAIKSVGAGLVLDDFGSGHSSFSWLADLPADGLKIDPNLMRRLGEPRTDTILSTVTLLAKRLNMTATAEGVEDKSKGAYLRQLGFDYVQGYAYARPMGAGDTIAYLKATRR